MEPGKPQNPANPPKKPAEPPAEKDAAFWDRLKKRNPFSKKWAASGEAGDVSARLRRMLYRCVAVVGAVILVVGLVALLRPARLARSGAAAPEPGVAAGRASVSDDLFWRPSDRADLDFESLQAQNGEIVAWIEVPGTNIDYAVAHTSDNDYYIDYNLSGERDSHGAIFIDYYNNPDFGDRNTVIYGHNKFDGTMFTELHHFEDPAFFAQNRTINVYFADGGMYSYRIFAAFATDDVNILYRYDISDPDMPARLLADIESNADPAANIDLSGVGANDRFLTLSTCVFYEPSARYVVLAVLVG